MLQVSTNRLIFSHSAKACLLCFLAFATTCLSAQDSTSFKLRFSENAFSKPFSGDVFVAFSQRGEPRESMHQWFGAPPLARFSVNNVSPGEQVTFTLADAAARYPSDWNDVVNKQWKIQAVARVNQTARMAGRGVGDVYSNVVTGKFDNESFELDLDQVVSAKPFKESDRIRLFTMESPSLSKFFGFGYQIRAGVMLPKDYDANKKYPVVYDVPGFGGTHEGISRKLARLPSDSYLQECIVVIPDPSNRFGHSVFCNSRSIGPWGDALVRELIPQLEAKYGGAGAEHRYVTGVSSGGWSCLYLQVTYPTEFAGCWSHVPDPIDFHDFQQINLYEPLPNGEARNMYVDEQGAPRPLARRGTQVMLTYEAFVRREHVTNPGGQIRSFEATFSRPEKPGGPPQRVFDVETGKVNHSVAQTWREYDLSHQLLTRWGELKKELAGKIHIFAGELDSFYLNGAVERFQKLAQTAGLLEDMEVKIIPKMAHSLYQQGNEEMLETIEKRFKAATIK